MSLISQLNSIWNFCYYIILVCCFDTLSVVFVIRAIFLHMCDFDCSDLVHELQNWQDETEIEKKLLSQKGRKVKCFNCSNYWIQHVDGKVVKLNLEDSFSTELNRRENLVKNSLNKSKLISKETNEKESVLTAQEEKELLSSLAISEIEKNRNSKNNLSYTDSNSMNRVENIRGKLKNPQKSLSEGF